MPALKLRSIARKALTEHEAAYCIKQFDFFHSGPLDAFEDFWWQNPEGSGIQHEYELIQGGTLMADRATQLLWQRSSGPNTSFDQACESIRRLNQESFGGFSDWRLPTLEETMSLLEPRSRPESSVDPLFCSGSGWIWTCDQRSERDIWVVSLRYGTCFHCDRKVNWYSSRAVRSGVPVATDH